MTFIEGNASPISVPDQILLAEASPSALSWANWVWVIASSIAGFAESVFFVFWTFQFGEMRLGGVKYVWSY